MRSRVGPPRCRCPGRVCPRPGHVQDERQTTSVGDEVVCRSDGRDRPGLSRSAIA